MNLISLLSTSINTYGGFGMPYNLNWIGKCIQWLIESCNSIGLGIILFTLAIKLITLPLDIISRTSMKKNSLKMEKMRPQLEKLQRQYANNKQLYNQKISALYKKEGYSMFASCLPTLVTLVFFIVVIGQFSTYSNYANLQMINDMSRAYTQSIENYDDNYVYKVKDENGDLEKMIISERKERDGSTIQYYSIVAYLNENYVFDNAEEFSDYKNFITKTEKNEYEASFVASNINDFAKEVIELNKQGFSEVIVETGKEGEDVNICHIIKSGDNYIFNEKMYDNLTQDEMNAIATPKVMKYAFNKYSETHILNTARLAAKQAYYDNAPNFLWIKNLWVPDLPYKHPVNATLASYDFSKQLGDFSGDETQFAEITSCLSTEKSAPNGYFILIVLSIGIMLLSQWITQKSQKAQLELQSVDGQAAMNSKMMMWMMPIMFGVFAFFYSGSFSLYMTVSTLLSTLFTIIINFIVEKTFKNKYGA